MSQYQTRTLGKVPAKSHGCCAFRWTTLIFQRKGEVVFGVNY